MPKGRRSHLHPRSGRAVRCPNDGWRRVEAGAVVRSRCLGSPCPGAGLPSPPRLLPLRLSLPAAPHLSPCATSSRTCVSPSLAGTTRGMRTRVPRSRVPLGTQEEAVPTAARREIGVGWTTVTAGSLPSRGRTEAQLTSAAGRVGAPSGYSGYSTRHVDARPAEAPAPAWLTVRRPASAADLAHARATLWSLPWGGRDTSLADVSARPITLGRPPYTRR